jgi:Lon protease-like protein
VKTVMRGERGGTRMLRDVLLALVVLFVAYQWWFKSQSTSVPPSQSPAAVTGEATTAVKPATVTVTERPPASPDPVTQPSRQELVQMPSPSLPERPALDLAQRAAVDTRTSQVRDAGRSDVFPEASRQVPLLLVSQMAPNNLGMYSTNPGALFLTDIVVRHEPTGKGEVGTDGPYGQSVLVSLHNAVQVASYTVGYDVRFLQVRLIGRTRAGIAINIEGPSAGAIMAVAVASALLGDSIRSDICMSGTIRADLRVGPVGGLSDKIAGCRQGNYRELIVPNGQTSMDLALKSMSTEIKITEINTFAEAYEAATGQTLRRL